MMLALVRRPFLLESSFIFSALSCSFHAKCTDFYHILCNQLYDMDKACKYLLQIIFKMTQNQAEFKESHCFL